MALRKRANGCDLKFYKESTPTNTVVSDADETVSADTPASDDCQPTEDFDVSDSTGKKRCLDESETDHLPKRQCDDDSLMIVGHSDEATLK